jgi:hypothetical protein
MVNFIYQAIHDPVQSIHKVATERAVNEYLYVKVKPILELEARDLCQV